MEGYLTSYYDFSSFVSITFSYSTRKTLGFLKLTFIELTEFSES